MMFCTRMNRDCVNTENWQKRALKLTLQGRFCIGATIHRQNNNSFLRRFFFIHFILYWAIGSVNFTNGIFNISFMLCMASNHCHHIVNISLVYEGSSRYNWLKITFHAISLLYLSYKAIFDVILHIFLSYV